MLVKQFMQIFLKRISCCLPFLVLFLLTACKDKDSVAVRDWPVYGGTPENNHYSALDQINRSNVKNLQVAWSYDTGEQGGLQTSPLMVGDVFYGISPTQKVVALNAATGKELWKFDAGTKGLQPDRGLAYWSSGSDRRIFVGVMSFVYALDATTGKPIPAFGKDGRIDLQENLGREARWQSIALTSPGIVYKDLIILGGRNPETLPAPPEIFALTTYVVDNCDGHFTPSLIPASSVTKPGPRTRGSRVAPPIIGRGWRSTANVELFLFQPGRLLLTFTVAIGSATTSLLIVCWR